MKKDFSKMTLNDLFIYLEDLDFEASVLNRSTISLLENEDLSKDLHYILYNTLIALKNGEITINKCKITPYEEKKKQLEYSAPMFVEPAKNAKRITSPCWFLQTLRGYLDWDVQGVGSAGTRFIPHGSKSSSGFSFDSEDRTLRYKNESFILGEDFTHVNHIYEEGLYLFLKTNKELKGVVFIPWQEKN